MNNYYLFFPHYCRKFGSSKTVSTKCIVFEKKGEKKNLSFTFNDWLSVLVLMIKKENHCAVLLGTICQCQSLLFFSSREFFRVFILPSFCKVLTDIQMCGRVYI